MKTYVGRLIFENGQFYTSSNDIDKVTERLYANFGDLHVEHPVIFQITEIDVMDNHDEVVEEYRFEYRNGRWLMVEWVI